MNIHGDFEGCYGRDGGDDRFTRFMISNADREKSWSKVASISPNAGGYPVQRCHATDGQLGDGQSKPARPKWPHSAITGQRALTGHATGGQAGQSGLNLRCIGMVGKRRQAGAHLAQLTWMCT